MNKSDRALLNSGKSMNKTDATKRCNCGPGRSLAMFLFAGALFLAILAGLLMAGGFAMVLCLFLTTSMAHKNVPLGTTQSPPVEVPHPPLLGNAQHDILSGLSGAGLIIIIVLLLLVLILLLVLLWCCCCGGRNKSIPADLLAKLVPLIPILPEIPKALRLVVEASKISARALNTIQNAGNSLANVPAFSATAQVVQKASDAPQAVLDVLGGLFPVKSSLGPVDVSGFATGVTNIVAAGNSLKAAADNDITKAITALKAVANVLGPVATSLGAPPPQGSSPP